MTDLKRLSKFLALMLRHEPEQFGLTLDSEGFTDVDGVWAQVVKRYKDRYTRADLDTLLNESKDGRQRYQLVDGRIRAMYGHSAVSIEYPPVTPPDILYHGTVPQVLNLIKKEGLTSQSRQYVHLSSTEDRATEVATRHGKPIILKIRALEAHENGIIFHNPEPKHYLARTIPPEYIEW